MAVPKLKSHSGAKKRFRTTGSGKIAGKKAGRKHNLSHKSRNRTRNLERGLILNPIEAAKIKVLLPNG